MAADNKTLRDYLNRATIELHQTRQSLRELDGQRREPIAIVGMSCRYPGGVQSPTGLWQLVSSAVDAASPFPDDRSWDVDGLYDPDLAKPGTSYVREGSFLSDVGEFDAQFFGISPREALAMDPQQRLLLEGAWETLEDAGIDPASLRGTQTGVFVGVMSSDYGVVGSGVAVPGDLEAYAGTGIAGSVASGRVAYTFGLEGPAMSVDTACSSSLVAIHLASQALRSGECSMALAGGVTVMSTPASIVGLSRQRALAPDGRCKAFGAGADGMGTSEGMGMVLLEPLSQAKRNGHEVLAVIRGSATNQDGASNGLTAPNGPSQERVIAQALASARLGSADIDAVEAHGTGTALGDPIEAQALLATYGQERGEDGAPLHLGSIKSNIGHTQAAAGVAGVIKMVQAMRHGVLPKTLHAEEPSEHIEWSAGEVSLLNEEVAWEPNGRPRRAGVSSFGISGTNAHLILEEAPAPEQEDADASEGSESPEDSAPALFDQLGKGAPVPWVLSAKSEEALREQARRLAAHLKDSEDTDPADVGLSLSARSAFEYRAVLVAEGIEGFTEGLSALAEGRPTPNLIVGRASAQGKAAFLFPGQGSQWQGMAVELWDASPFFAEAMEECEQALSPYVEWSLRDVLESKEGAPSLDRVDVVQPALFAVMVSLARLWSAWGVRPDVVVGHSQGEIAAAHIAGALSLPDAARVIALRSKALAKLSGKGGMLSVAIGAKEATTRIESWGERISLAAVNGPASVVLSGELEALEELLAELEAEEIRARMIPVDYAAHSHQVEAIQAELLEGCEPIEPQSSKVPFFSTVSAELLDTKELDAEYWYRNLRETVRFERATEALLEQGHRAFLEASPHPGLLMSLQESAERNLPDTEQIAAVGSLRREDGGPERFLCSLAELWVSGGSIEWREAFEGSGAKRVALPTYPFQRERFWLGGGIGAGDVTALGQASAEHPLLGAAVGLASGQEWLFTGRISTETHPWLADHAVFGTTILPGTAFLELALHAGAHVGLGTVEELIMQAPLALGEQSAAQIQVSLGAPEQDGRRQVEIYSRQEQSSDEEQPEAEQWTRHASGSLIPAAPPAPAELAAEWPPEGAEQVEVEGLYDHLAAAGFEYGPAFQGLTGAWRRGEEVFAEVSLPETERQRGDSFSLHPALFDAALHSGGAAWLDSEAKEQPQMGLPFAWSGVSLHAQGPTALRVRLSRAKTKEGTPEDSPTAAAISVLLADQDGAPVGSVASLTTRPVSETELGSLGGHYESLFCLEWIPLEAGQATAEQSALALIGSGEGPLAKALASSGVPLETHADPVALAGALGEGEQAPALVLLDASEHPTAELPESVHSALHHTLEMIQSWLSEERFAESRLVLLSRGALSVGPADRLSDLAAAPLWGLLRSAQSEHPERFALLDIDTEEASLAALPGALGALTEQGESQLALRGGELFVPRLARASSGGGLVPPEGSPHWRLEAGGTGTLEDLVLLPSPGADAELEAGQVRVGVRAAGVNFRDVLITLGMYPEPAPIGGEGAGIVLEVGPGVEGLAVGDRVMGLLPDAFGPLAVTDQRMIAKIPAGWSFTQAASVPIAFLTAHFALTDLAGLKAGEKLLIHAAAGGVGMAAVQLARHLGAEVFATASKEKWGALEQLGLEETQIASSRTLDFKDSFLEVSGGEGVDVVLDSLAREFVDASLELLPRGGRFIEMGKTDVRDPEQVAAQHPGVAYRAFDMAEAGPERIGEMLSELIALFEQGVLEPLPTRVWDVRRAPEAFRFMSQARHTGKNVLSVPQPIDPAATALITGGTGVLGGLLARHLVSEHGVSQLLLASRQGEEAEGAKELGEELEELGAEVRIAACDVGDREQLEALIDSIPQSNPLKTVIHTAGTLDDGTIDSLTPERLDTVLAPKADAAWHLHELTEQLDLDAFVMFSSAAATVGSPGQGNYAAANTFMDALASYRRARGLPASSLAWGLWEKRSGLTGDLGEADLSRMERGGVGALSSAEGLELFDAAHGSEEALMLPVRLDIAKLRAGARAGLIPPLLRGLLSSASRPAVESGSLARRLAAAPEEEREAVALELLCAHIATVLGHSSADAIDPQSAFKDLGFDSLSAVELRNRLNTATGLRLPATLVFDYPTPAALAGYLLKEVVGGESKAVAQIAVVAHDEPIAIVGMSCRYPGDASSPRELWQLVRGGIDAVADFPEQRGWDVGGLYDADPSRPGTSYVKEGAFLRNAGDFDAAFFGISPREALAMDPQQRLLLEGAWEAMEDAGIDPVELRGSPTGVFTGVMGSDYGVIGSGTMHAELEGYLATGIAGSVASGRVAYTFGLEGPAMSIDTACSSSLVAIHLASQAMRQGECSMALAGGVTVMSTPATIVELSRQRVLAPDGRCKSFGSGADGMSTSEGMGMVLLEPLSQAKRNGHEVLAVIRGSATNQDGASNGLTAPNGPSQERVIAQALASARLGSADIDAVEAHGTGTALGDPIEAQALLATYGQERGEDGAPLHLGSIKSNIGHTQAAAGVAGVIKMVQAMRHGVLPKTLHAEEPSEHIEWSAGEVSLLNEEVAWEPNGRPRRAGVSSFGISGTNAHLILEEAPAPEQEDADASEGSESPEDSAPALFDQLGKGAPVPWVLSAKSEEALREQARRLAAHLKDSEDTDPADVGLSLSARSAFEYRAVLVAEGIEGFTEGLSALAEGRPTPNLIVGRASAQGKAAFLFPGQGSQWQGMAVELWDASPFFAEAMEECEQALSPYVEWSLRDVLESKEGAPSLDRVDVVQPALFAVMVSLARLWSAWGVRPDVVVGHSQGEIAAAHIAGALSLPDAARVIALRSKALAKLSGKGGMLSVAIGAKEATTRIESWGERISLAAVNGPASVVLSGELEALEELLAELEAEEIRARMIPVDYAAHSHQVEAIQAELLEGCEPIEPQSSKVPFFSTVSAELLDTKELDAEYWYRNLRETVRFERATEALLEQGHRAFLEASPHPGLLMSLQESAERNLPDTEQIAAVGSLRREDGGPERFLCSLAELWVSGGSIEWREAFEGSGAKRVALPTYPFQRERFWLGGGIGAGDVTALGQASAEHPLLGAAVGLASGQEWLFTGRISTETHPWLADHAVFGTTILPGTAFLELALHAGAHVGLGTVEELIMQAPLALGEQSAAQIQVSLGAPEQDGRRQVEIYSRQEQSSDEEQPEAEQWTRHASGSLIPAAPPAPAELAAEWPPEGAEQVEVEGLYDHLAAAGFEYGPAFQGLTGAWRRGEEVFAEVSLPETERQRGDSFSLHPALFDAALHSGGAAWLDSEAKEQPQMGLPFAWSGVSLHAQGPTALRVRLSRAKTKEGTPEDSPTAAAISVLLADQDGAPVGSVASLTTRPVSETELGSLGGHYESLFCLEWIPLEAGQATAEQSALALIGSGEGPLAKALASSGVPLETHADPVALAGALGEGEQAPALVLLDASEHPTAELPESVHSALHHTLEMIQSWLSEERFAESRLVLLSRGALSVGPADRLSDLAAAPLWGLLRSAQSEHPERFALLDIDTEEASLAALPGALGALTEQGESQLALRGGELFVPRLARASSGGGLVPPEGSPHWRLEAGGTGTLEDLVLLPSPGADAELEAGQVRVGVRAAGVNFRDVLITLGMYPEPAPIGGEGAGIVLEVGPGVEGLAVGDRVMGLLPDAFGPLAVTDQRMIAKIPAGWSFTQAASVPIAFLTAHFALTDLAGLKAGEKLLIHAAAGGVGMAAVQLARHLGAEVFATASKEKWGALEQLGLEETQIASSRTLDFKDSFLEVSGGEGVDVVLDSLAREFVDASLELLPRGGRFIEMGKTDVRDPEQVAAQHPGVAYRAFDMAEAGPERIGEMLSELIALFEQGVLEPLPTRVWDVRRAPEAFRFMSQARHTGKNVLSVPQPIDPAATALITGGTGVLGGLLARHLVSEHGVSQLLLASRQGEEAEGAKELGEELEELGAEVRIAACDVGDREQLEALIDSIPQSNPLKTVIHTAGTLDDGTIDSLTPERLDTVLAPKADAAWHLHELTEQLDLDAFVMFSSAAATVGSPGQGNYAAANTFMDALASYRRARGLPASSLAWGLWEKRSGLTGDLGEADLSRMERGGVGALSSAEGLELFDAAHGSEEALMLPVRLDIAKLRAGARAGLIPPLLRGLLSSASRPAVESGSLARRLAAAPEEEREAVALELLCAHIATVLGHSSADAIDPQSAFKDLGFDSLSAVELRNRLNTATGLRLPATLVFDYPTPAALAGYLLKEVVGGESKAVAQIAVVAHDEPIAIVGMSCRYPGGVQSPKGLWQLVSSAVDAASPFPDDRSWDVDGLYDPDLAKPGTSYVREGSFLSDVGEFDAQFFGISPREALAMDPQQRLLLEGAWETLEDAGIDPASLRGTQTGVFAGVINSDYGVMSTVEMRAGLEGYLGTGNTASVASGRVAYTFGLEGPAMSVDTACSSSLVAIHLASQALRQGECSMALAGGVTVMSTPATIVELSRQHVLARDGRCKAFGAGADGMGTSEGMGMVLLEPLSQAKRNGHEVLAVIRGSATNQDGASNGLTAPNGPSQERVIAQALASARLGTADIDAVEAHGTGTALGDPIEAQALLATYGQERGEDGAPLHLGSIKSNIGHTQAAAGVAGVIKMVQAMRHGVLPKTLHAEEPSEHIEWSAGEVSLLNEEVAWEPNGRPRRAGVSSFGISGTNAHLILEEAPAPEEGDADAPGGSESPEDSAPALFDRFGKGAPVPWVLSAKSEEALREQARRLAAHLKDSEDTDPADVGLSLGARSAFEHRAVLVAEDIEGFTEGLSALAEGRPTPNLIVGRASAQGKAAFLFPGQGSQRVGMGKELYEASPLFRAALDEAFVHLDAQLQGECSLRDVIWESDQSSQEGLLDQTRFAQAGLFALELALFRFLEALGVKHDFLIGHSIGELSAAHVAGMLSLQDACTLVAARARLMQELPTGGAMVSIQAAEQDVLQLLEGTEGLRERVCVAAVNGPASVVVSGDEDAVFEVAKSWEERGRKTKHLNVSHAFHSSHMEPMLEEFSRVAEGLEFTRPKVPIVSNVSGERGSAEQMCAPEYWARHVREAVRFADGVRWLQSQGVSRFLELGPDGVLSAMVHDSARDLQGDEDLPFAAPLMRKERPEVRALLSSLAELWVSGGSIEWTKALAGSGAKRIGLPTYPFQRERFWLGGGIGAGDVTALGQASAEHPLLGAAVGLASGQEWLFTGRISLETHPWLADHAVFGTTILPGTAFLELALHAGAHVGLGTVEELIMQAPLVLPEQSAAQIQVSLGAPDQDGRRQVEIYSRQEQSSAEEQPEPEQWTRHASGTLIPAAPPAPAELAAEWPPQGAEQVEVEGLYDHLAAAGFEYGPAFQGLTGAWRRGEEVFAEVSLPETERQRGDSFSLHPALFDAALHSGGAAWLDSEAKEQPQMGLPFAWSGVSLHAQGPTALRVRLSRAKTKEGTPEDSPTAAAISVLLADQDGAPVGSVASLTTRPVSETELGSLGGHYESLFCLEWIPLEAGQATAEQSALALIGSGEGPLAKALASSGVPLETHADPVALAGALPEGGQAPALVLLDASEHPTKELPESAHSALHHTLEMIQSWLSDERFAESRLVVLSRKALSVGPADELGDLAAAPLWGLLRSAQSEHPERFALLDIDTEDASVGALPGALAALTEQGEPQLALRGGELFVPRLARAAKQTRSGSPGDNEERVPSEFVTPGRSVLITGELGGSLARHLASKHGVRSLVLASEGMDAPGTAELEQELESLGTQVLLQACDVSDRGELEGLLSAIPSEHPLGAVIHTAATLDDGAIDTLTPERLDTVLTPKADAAWHLHELTEQLDLDAFVMFSSAAATVGSPGQGNYAAANTFMDALASYRRARGLPASSLAWGPAEERALLSANGLKLLDAALDAEEPLILSVDLDMAKLRAQARLGELPSLLSGLVRMSRPKKQPITADGGLVEHLAGMPASERAEAISVAIRDRLASILGHELPEKLGPDTPFLELGMDSLAALEMQIWMEEATGLRLPPTLLSEYQTLDQFSAYLHRQLEPVIEGGGRPSELAGGEQAGLGVGDLFRRALSLGLVDDGVALLESAATLRSASEAQLELGELPTSIRLCLGDDSPSLICIPSSLATAGPHQYVRFANHFRGARAVTVCPLPGFMDGERLPAALDDLLDAQAEAVRRSRGEGGKFALFGHSTGGTLAHALAARMVENGEAPAGVILIDTHPAMTSPGLLGHVFDEMLKRDQVMVRLSDTRLTAMAAYGRMLGEYEPRDLTCPTLMVKASEPMGDAAEAGEWETTWKHAHTSHQSPGDHFTMMEEHVEHTAEIVETWMATLDL